MNMLSHKVLLSLTMSAILFSCTQQREPHLIERPITVPSLPNVESPEPVFIAPSENVDEEKIDLSQSFNLAELIDLALKNNPETKKAWWQAKRAAAVVGLSKRNYYPLIEGHATASHQRQVEFPTGPSTNFSNYGGDVSLTYLLLDFGETSARVEAAKQALSAANWSADWMIQNIIFSVMASYYEFLNAKDILESRESSLKDAQVILDAAQDLFCAGLQATTDVYSSQSTVAQMEIDVAQQSAKVAIALGKLTMNLGLSVDEEILINSLPDEVRCERFSQDLKTLIITAHEKRADLLAKSAMLAEKNAELKAAKRAPLPKLRALGEGGWLQYNKHKGSSANYAGALSLDIPIFKGFEYTYQRKLKAADAKVTLEELRQLELEIAQEVLTHSEMFKAAEETFKFANEYLVAATKTYEGILSAYKAGTQNIFNLIDAQKALADARIQKTLAKTQWYVSLAQLAYSTGTLTH